MERLLCSSSSSSSHILRKPPSPFLSRLRPIDSPNLRFPPPARAQLRQVNLISCKHEHPPPSISSKPSNLLPPLLNGPVDSPKESVSASQIGQQKAFSAGKFVLLSVLIASLIHTLFASPAFATFQTAAKTGGPAAAVGRSLLPTVVLSSAWTGFLAGCLHTLSGPDHLAALAPLSIGRTRIESAAVGALWGCGHDAGQVIFGLMFLLLKDRLHIEVMQTWGTRVVGFTLVMIGAMGIREALEVPTPCIALENGESNPNNIYESLQTPTTIKKKKIGFATFATGIVHGLQPDALMMMLPALALPSRVAGAAFLVMFLVGTVVSMGSYTAFLGSCSEALKERIPRITEKLTWASSLVAIGLGVSILVSQLLGYSLY